MDFPIVRYISKKKKSWYLRIEQPNKENKGQITVCALPLMEVEEDGIHDMTEITNITKKKKSSLVHFLKIYIFSYCIAETS